ncbi:YbfB/YjiJ family MFS transporter [Chenggangzhangella methanolivorans]|uniref:YbfB/YjiJ family MFS transporter n=1 Tax=Chenggangzhangella methanolivorans TaxID=1437009 RepID=A0A9E6RDG1_9HYPH|nr:YbfB/YjiJ family MFS transporter [Chenggangzhangella methanolivorans]QZO01299.1 YbfB/YjiJ family MFS transporter [Chenggangzhangella methanolivorans]
MTSSDTVAQACACDAAPRSTPSVQPPAEALTSLWIVAGLAMAPAVAQGFGRFAYALVLPAMRDDLGWSWADAGAMGAANAIGYLIGAIVAAGLAQRYGAKRVFSVSLAASAIAIAAAALASDYWAQGALRLAAGVSSGVAFVVGGALAAAAASGAARPGRRPCSASMWRASAWASRSRRSPFRPSSPRPAGAAAGSLGLLSVLAALLAAPAVRRTPAPAMRTSGGRRGLDLRPILPVFVAYGLLGAGYIAYATFVVAHLKAELGFGAVEISAFWTVLGLSIVAFTFLWGSVLGRLRGGLGLIATTSIMMAASRSSFSSRLGPAPMCRPFCSARPASPR